MQFEKGDMVTLIDSLSYHSRYGEHCEVSDVLPHAGLIRISNWRDGEDKSLVRATAFRKVTGPW